MEFFLFFATFIHLYPPLLTFIDLYCNGSGSGIFDRMRRMAGRWESDGWDEWDEG
jgi:hypothetical protein